MARLSGRIGLAGSFSPSTAEGRSFEAMIERARAEAAARDAAAAREAAAIAERQQIARETAALQARIDRQRERESLEREVRQAREEREREARARIMAVDAASSSDPIPGDGSTVWRYRGETSVSGLANWVSSQRGPVTSANLSLAISNSAGEVVSVSTRMLVQAGYLPEGGYSSEQLRAAVARYVDDLGWNYEDTDVEIDGGIGYSDD